MEVFRLSSSKYSKELNASGAENRWNKRGEYVIYTGSSRAICTLELTIHQKGLALLKREYEMMVISIADQDHLFNEIKQNELPENWRTTKGYPVLQNIGSDWYKNKESLVLKIPSAVIPQEYNYMINTQHPEFTDKVALVRSEDYFWDERFLK